MSATEIMRSRDWLRAELLSVAVVHGLMGAVVAWAPAQIIVTAGSRPVFEIMPSALDIDAARSAWGVAFAIAGVALAFLAWSCGHAAQQLVVWASAATTGIWSAAFIIAAFNGSGSAIGAVIFPALLLWVGFLLIRVAQGSGDRCGDS